MTSLSNLEIQTKTCHKCCEDKPIICFSKHSGTADKLDNRCKECVAKVKKERKEKIKNGDEEPLEYKIYPFDYNISEWQVGKPTGTILERIDPKSGSQRFEVRYKIDGKIKSKSFAFTDTTKEQTHKKAEDYLCNFSAQNDLMRNRIRKIDDTTIEVELTKDMIMKTDIQFIDLCQKYTLVSSKAGSKNAKYYACITIGNTNHNFHNYITGFEMVDHINREPMDNRLINLRDTNPKQNNNNRTCREEVGIRLVDDRRGKYYEARIKQDNIQYSKTFSISRYGDVMAKQMALDYRKQLNDEHECKNGPTQDIEV